MSNPLKYSNYENNWGTYAPDLHIKSRTRKRVKINRPKSKKRKNPIIAVVALSITALYGYFICPYNYKNYFQPLFLNRFLNRNLHLDVNNFVQPATDKFHNSFILGEYILSPANQKSKEITNIKITGELQNTKEKLETLFKKYEGLEPSVFVWEYSTGKGLEINADKIYPSASIIKIPIAFELIKLVEESSKTNDPIQLNDRRMYTEFFKTPGSGHLQKTKLNVSYTIDHLANIMIADSDNSATNMLLYELGGVDGFNRSMRNLGLKATSMSNWLPDLDGTNKTTAREMSTILYNIDNPNYIDPNYRNVLKEYLGNTKNIHLIKEKLPKSAMVLHKTGNIGTMLGDSAVVYTDNGKKYIMTILVKRPHNDLRAKTLIQDASLEVYNDILALE